MTLLKGKGNKTSNKKKTVSPPQGSEKETGQRSVRSTREQMTYLIILIVFVLVTVFVDIRDNEQKPPPQYSLENGWTIESGLNVNLNDLPTGEHMIMHDLGDLPLNRFSLCLKSIDTTFTVYADGKSIYDFHPKIPRRLGLSYGMYVHTIPVPEGATTILIRVEPVFPDSPADLNDVFLGNSRQYLVQLFRDNMFSFVQCSITLLIGILFLISGLSSAVLMRSVGIDFIALGGTCALVGFYGFNDTLLLQMLTGRPELIRVLVYICLIFIPFPMLSFVASASGFSRSNLVSGMVTLCLANFLMQLLLTRRGISDYYYLVVISHLIVLLSFVISFCLLAKAKKEKTMSSHLRHTIFFGLISCAVCLTIDLVRSQYFTKYGSSTFTRIGVLIFTVLMINYLMRSQVDSLKKQNRKSTILVGEIAKAFAKVVDMKDTYTNGHSMRVAQYTAMLTKELGYDDETVEKYYNIALLHDVGKIGIPINILKKPGKLTDEEYAVIKTHTTKGYDVLKDISIMPDLAVGAESHHERPDGKGYPKGLSGDSIPRVAQIIAVADCFDAMYSDRPYRKRMEFDKVVSIIKEVSGTQLTPDVVDAFLRLVERGELKNTSGADAPPEDPKSA